MDSEKHSEEEIITAARNKVNNGGAYRVNEKIVVVKVSLSSIEDGVVYAYDVWFDKNNANSGSIIGDYKRYIKFTT
jgi:hypothetical protein